MERLTEWYDDGDHKGVMVKEERGEHVLKTLFDELDEGYLGMCELKAYEDTGLTPEQIMELKERDKPKRVVYEHEFEDNRLISYVQRCESCGEAYDPSERFNFCPNCGQRILRRKVIVKAFANYGFAGTEMEFEEEFPDNATDEEIEETMKDIVYEQVDWSWKKED